MSTDSLGRSLNPFIIQVPKRGWRLWISRLFRRSLTWPYLYTPPTPPEDGSAAVVMDMAGLWVFNGVVE